MKQWKTVLAICYDFWSWIDTGRIGWYRANSSPNWSGLFIASWCGFRASDADASFIWIISTTPPLSRSPRTWRGDVKKCKCQRSLHARKVSLGVPLRVRPHNLKLYALGISGPAGWIYLWRYLGLEGNSLMVSPVCPIMPWMNMSMILL